MLPAIRLMEDTVQEPMPFIATEATAEAARHLHLAEAWVAEAAADSGLTEDEIASDVLHAYKDGELEDPEVIAEFMRMAGIESRAW